jgi:outer membrane protein
MPAVAGLLLSLATPASALTLEEAQAAALASNPAIAEADARLDQARARVRQADGALLPTATIQGSVGTGRLDPKGYFGLQAADVTPSTALATLEQPLFAGGRIMAGRQGARSARTGAEASNRLTRSRLSVEVAAAYAGLATARREVDMRQSQLAMMREIERQSGLRFKAGDAPSTDLSQARARLAEAEAGLEAARADAASAAARFAELTGLPGDDLAPIPPPPPVPDNREAAVAAALSANPALAASAGAAKAATAGAKAAKAEWLPMVGAYAEASRVRDQFFPDYAADQAVVGLRARWTLFDGSRQGRIAEASAGANAARAAEAGARRSVEAAAISAWEGLTAARRMAEASARRRTAAAEALRATRLEVKVGMKPQLALLDAEREALDAEVMAIRADGAVLTAGWQLKALTGS